jgi:hypothetical protein
MPTKSWSTRNLAAPSAVVREGTLGVYVQHLLIGCFLLLAYSCPAGAQLLDYGKFSGYGIEKGILGNDYQHPKAACITGTKSPLLASNAAIRVSIVSSADEYKQAFHIDQKAEASFLGIAGGGEELHFGQENSGSSSAFDIIVEAYGEHNSETVDHITWDAPYNTMLASGNAAKIQEVREACGDRYIETVFNETRLFAVLHVSKQQNSALTTFSGNAHGKVDLDVVSASSSLGGDANVSSAHQAGAVTISIYTEGFGDDFVAPTATAIGIASADGLDGVSTKLSAYLATLHATGQPVKYQLEKLPLLPAGDLSDARIFDYLNDFKSAYFSTHVRVENLKSLLLPTDPRRIFFREPQADVAIKQQQDTLTTYFNAVAKAHDACRKALTLDVCIASANAIGTSPQISSLELPPAGPPLVGVYMFAIDGTPVPQGQSSLLFSSSGMTLLDSARAIKPNASNVDVLVPIFGGEYLSYIDVGAAPPVFSPVVAGIRRLLGQDLKWPTYWKDASRPGAALRVLHADAQHPCNISKSGGLNVIDQSCLTKEGRALRDLALAYVAQLAWGPPKTFDFPMMGATTNCFGQSSPVPLALFHLVISSGASPSDVKAQVGLFLPLVNVSLPLVEQEDSHDPHTWTQLAQTRIAALVTPGNGAAGYNPCAPHLP